MLALGALLHDAAEAYVGDVPRPLKGILTDFEKIELKIINRIHDKFKVSLDDSQQDLIKRIDDVALREEAARYMASGGNDWAWSQELDFRSGIPAGAIAEVFGSRCPCGFEIAQEAFLKRFYELSD